MDTIQGLYNPNGRLNVENGLNTKLTGCDRPGRTGDWSDADSSDVEWHTADRDLSHGFGKRDGEIGRRAGGGEVERGTRKGGAFRCIQ